jgi:hypothetical protein
MKALELQARMRRIGLEMPIGCPSAPLNVTRQLGESFAERRMKSRDHS